MNSWLDPPAWAADALCRGTDPNLWHPGRGVKPPKAFFDACKVCPVRAECLNFALAEGIAFGIYGGLAERPRRSLRARGEFVGRDASVLWDRETGTVVIEDRHPATITAAEARAALAPFMFDPDARKIEPVAVAG